MNKETNIINETIQTGKDLLLDPRLNKGTAFSSAERDRLQLNGLLPAVVETIDQQLSRTYAQYCGKTNDLDKNLFLNDIYLTNTTLFFALVSAHLDEMLPIVYTPTIAEAVTSFSSNYSRPQGLIIAFNDRDRIDDIFRQLADRPVDIAVVTDGEGVLGIGDQGVGGLKIAIGKLMVYTLCGGLNPFKTAAVQLDVGTNNEDLLNDPLYLGWRHKRISGSEYHEFIEKFVAAFKRWLPQTLLHWEDFGRDNARVVLDRYRSVHQSFNDDIQGTGAVAVSAVLTGMRKSNIPSVNHKICIFGAGTAGSGIAEQLCQSLAVLEKTDVATIRKRVYMIDRNGLLMDNQPDLQPFQQPYARHPEEISGWQPGQQKYPGLLDVIRNAQPTVLIGCSTRTGAFSPEILGEMYKHCARPIIMPISNPTSKAEATPGTILAATEGNALIATGSPFGKVNYNGQEIEISQCNNALIFPGLGMGMLISRAKELTDTMLLAASNALTEFCMADKRKNAILPDFAQVHKISQHVAIAVAQQAARDGVAAGATTEELQDALNKITWRPEYQDN